MIDTVLDPADAPNIVERAKADEDLDTLVTAVVTAGLVDAFLATALTVFAPTNAAFALLGDAVTELLEEDPPETLIEILKYHVYAGEVLEADAIALDGQTVTMFNSGVMTIDVEDGKVVLNTQGTAATVIVTDILASNGVIHKIDAVLDVDDGDDD